MDKETEGSSKVVALEGCRPGGEPFFALIGNPENHNYLGYQNHLGQKQPKQGKVVPFPPPQSHK